jgi:hypothetical protein
VRNLEQIVEHIRVAAGADFAFVLTRKGRLVTHRAPRDMPEEGRARLLRAARPLLDGGVAALTLPREELVPYGGAAPLDVYVGVAAEQAIVCVAMATWADKVRVAPALEAGIEAIEPLLRRGLPTARRPAADPGPAKGSPFVAAPSAPPAAPSAPPPRASMPLIDIRPSIIPGVPVPGLSSLPEITMGEAPLGRESLVAVHREVASGGSAPEIRVSEAPLGRESLVAIRRDVASGGSAPEIAVGEASLGRATLAAIDMDALPRAPSSPDAIRVELVSMPDVDVPAGGRSTLPWVELPGDAKRAVDAAGLGRKLAPPKVTIKLEDGDEEGGAER